MLFDYRFAMFIDPLSTDVAFHVVALFSPPPPPTCASSCNAAYPCSVCCQVESLPFGCFAGVNAMGLCIDLLPFGMDITRFEGWQLIPHRLIRRMYLSTFSKLAS